MISKAFDILERTWAGPSGRRLAGSLLVLFFLVSLVLVELNRFGLLPESFNRLVPGNHLAAIQATLTLLLIIEVIGLIFSLVESVTTSVGRQLEILSLILLRNVFKEISLYEEPLVWEHFTDNIGCLAATSFAALFIFAALSVFYSVKKEEALVGLEEEKKQFILSKKAVAIGLLVFFHLVLARWVYFFFTGGNITEPFETFYTLLVISDVLILFLSMRYGHDYRIAFRNSAFAVVTVFIRIALIATPYYSAAIGTGAAIFALCTLVVYNRAVRSENILL